MFAIQKLYVKSFIQYEVKLAEKPWKFSKLSDVNFTNMLPPVET